jgi:AcrR family transcriptional regulator
MTRPYRMGRRQASVDRTAQSVLAAARTLLEQRPSAQVSVGAVARQAGVSRLTVYSRFGSKAALLGALALRPAPAGVPEADARSALHEYLAASSSAWAKSPALFRHLPEPAAGDPESAHRLAERLLAADALRPGCSIREAEDVIDALASFAVFDRLHRDGRRSPSAVTEILMRLAGGILA